MEDDKENLINDDQKIFQDNQKNGSQPNKIRMEDDQKQINLIFFVLPP